MKLPISSLVPCKHGLGKKNLSQTHSSKKSVLAFSPKTPKKIPKVSCVAMRKGM